MCESFLGVIDDIWHVFAVVLSVFLHVFFVFLVLLSMSVDMKHSLWTLGGSFWSLCMIWTSFFACLCGLFKGLNTKLSIKKECSNTTFVLLCISPALNFQPM